MTDATQGKRPQPHVFLSYAWTSEDHRNRVRQWAEDLVRDGVMVVLDVWDTREGNDLTAFMERTVTDAEITHVLIICDRMYAEKADARRAGVGTETQLISKKVYDEVGQSKFIPVFCELDDAGKPVVPAYLNGRKGIDFSSVDKVNANWEQLIRVLHGQPRFVKPQLGKPPAYLSDASSTPDPARRKFQELKRADEMNAGNIAAVRADFLDACIEFADALRMRKRPSEGEPGARIIADCSKLIAVRDHIVDWVLLEAVDMPHFEVALIETMERLAELKSRPPEVSSWDSSWFQAHEFFAYETFLYVIAALVRRKAFSSVRAVLTANYLRPETERQGDNHFFSYQKFSYDGAMLQAALRPPEGRKFLSPAAELVSRQAQRSDVKFKDLVEADYLVFFKSIVNGELGWYPQLLHKHSRYTQFPLFVKAARQTDFGALAVVLGKEASAKGAEEIRIAVGKMFERTQLWGDFWPDELQWPMNLKGLCTLP